MTRKAEHDSRDLQRVADRLLVLETADARGRHDEWAVKARTDDVSLDVAQVAFNVAGIERHHAQFQSVVALLQTVICA